MQLLKVRACAIMMSSSARAMVSAYQMSGSVTGTQTVKMDPMNTTPVLKSPVNPGISSVLTSSASHQAGSAMVTMTAGTWVTKWTAQRHLLAALQTSGCAPPIRCALTWTRCATTRKTAPTVLMNQNSAVSSHMSSKKTSLQSVAHKSNIINTNDIMSIVLHDSTRNVRQ